METDGDLADWRTDGLTGWRTDGLKKTDETDMTDWQKKQQRIRGTFIENTIWSQISQ